VPERLVEASGQVIPAHLTWGVAPLASCEAVLVFHENPVLLVEVEVLEVVAGAGPVPEVEIQAFAVSKIPDVDDVLVDPKRWSWRCSGSSSCSIPQRTRL
jgi:hypothetical protein